LCGLGLVIPSPDQAALRDLVEKDGVALGILKVGAEVGDAAGAPGVLEVVVEPTEENVLGGELKEVLELR